MPSPGELAWIAVIPCAVVVVVAIVLLGPPLGRIVFPRSGVTFWPVIANADPPPDPERTEHARFLLALTAPLLLTGCVLVGLHRARTLAAATIVRLSAGTQVAALAFLAICVVVQQRHTFSPFASQPTHVVYFTPATFAVAGAIALAIGAGVACEGIRRRFGALLRETRARRIAGSVVALAAIAIWLLPAINFERTIGDAHPSIVEHMPYWLDEVFALLDGRFPLVDYAAQYASLWPYPIAGAMALFGDSIGVFTIAMSTIGVVAMLAMYAVFRRVAHSTAAAVLLFLPFLATSCFMMEGPLDNRYAVGNLFGTFPLRYAGPFLLVWLVARQLDGASPRRIGWLFLAGGVVVLNNGEFGFPALGATVAALLWSWGRPTRAQLRRLAIEAAVGLAGAVALVSVLTLATAGALPHLELVVRFSRLFALAGWGLVTMTPTLGMSTVIFLTYVASVGVATVRAATNEPDRVMTGLLAWSGVFGLGVGGYYMGRSHPQVLTNMFPAWALSVTLLLVLAVRAIAARPSRRPTLAEAVCLLGFGVLACSLAQTPTPWSQVARLQRTGEPLYEQPLGEPFIAAHTRPGETVAILTLLGHRASYRLGLDDVTLYAGGGSMPTIDQYDEVLADLRAAGGRKVFVSVPDEWAGVADALVQRGYRVAAREPYGMVELSRAVAGASRRR